MINSAITISEGTDSVDISLIPTEYSVENISLVIKLISTEFRQK